MDKTDVKRRIKRIERISNGWVVHIEGDEGYYDISMNDMELIDEIIAGGQKIETDGGGDPAPK